MECEFCHRPFPDPASLQRHVQEAHAACPFAPRCEICGETFESPADLKAHHEGVHRAGRT